MRQSKLLFYGKLAEKALQTYERDGWGEFPTQIVVERREIRPTADRGPILLCVDTSGMTSPALYLTVGLCTVAHGLTTACAGVSHHTAYSRFKCAKCPRLSWRLF